MHFWVIAAAIFILASSILAKSVPQRAGNLEQNNIEVETQVLSKTTEKNIETETIDSVKPEPTSQPVTNNLIYPDSEYISENKYQTLDDPDAVTEWYKNQIRSLNYNVKNFVSTSVNGKVENKLTGANSSDELNIVITKSSDDALTIINIQ